MCLRTRTLKAPHGPGRDDERKHPSHHRHPDNHVMDCQVTALHLPCFIQLFISSMAFKKLTEPVSVGGCQVAMVQDRIVDKVACPPTLVTIHMARGTLSTANALLLPRRRSARPPDACIFWLQPELRERRRWLSQAHRVRRVDVWPAFWKVKQCLTEDEIGCRPNANTPHGEFIAE